MKQISLSSIETFLPMQRVSWRIWGVLVAPVRLWQWTRHGAWCWTMEGKREPLRYRVEAALMMIRARYFDWRD